MRIFRGEGRRPAKTDSQGGAVGRVGRLAASAARGLKAVRSIESPRGSKDEFRTVGAPEDTDIRHELAEPSPAGAATARTGLVPGDQVRHVQVGDLRRAYLVHVPPGLDLSRPAPLVLAFHGGGATPWGFAAVTDLSMVAGRSGFVVAYPVGYKRSWNAGDTGGAAKEEGVDDVRFVSSLLRDLEGELAIDHDRIYATGWSNGGKMSLRVVCELGDTVAAVAVVGSGLGSPCALSRPTPLLLFHGTADTFHPYLGGVGTDPVAGDVSQRGAPETVRLWAQLNGCVDRTRVLYQRGAALAVQYSSCPNGAEVTLVTIEEMGHQWPGHTIDPDTPGLPGWAKRLGPGTDDINATAEIVAFFNRH